MKKIITSVVAAAAITSSAYAGALYNSVDGATLADVQAIYVPNESIAQLDDIVSTSAGTVAVGANGTYTTTAPAGSIVAGTAQESFLTYSPSTDLPSGTRLVFTVTNAEWDTSAAYTLIDNAGAVDADPAVGVVVATSDSTVSGTLTFIVGNTPVTSGSKLVVSQATVAPAAGVTFNLTTDALATAGAACTVAVTEAYDSVGNIAGGLASAKTFVKSYQQFTAAVVAAGSSVIDVQQPSLRTNFVVDATAPATTLTTSKSTVSVTDHGADADIDASIVGNQTATHKIDLDNAALATLDYNIAAASSISGIASAQIETDAPASATAYTLNSVANTLTASIATDVDTDFYNGVADTNTITIDGTTEMSPESFTQSIALTFLTNQLNSETLLAPTAVDDWQINGYQGYIPYVRSDAGTATYITFANDSTISADVFFDVTDEAGTTITNIQVPVNGSAAYAPLAPGEAGLYNAATIRNAAIASGQTGAATFSANGKYRVLSTINAPRNQVFGTALQSVDNNTRERVLPIYHNDTVTAGNYKSY